MMIVKLNLIFLKKIGKTTSPENLNFKLKLKKLLKNYFKRISSA